MMKSKSENEKRHDERKHTELSGTSGGEESDEFPREMPDDKFPRKEFDQDDEKPVGKTYSMNETGKERTILKTSPSYTYTGQPP